MGINGWRFHIRRVNGQYMDRDYLLKNLRRIWHADVLHMKNNNEARQRDAPKQRLWLSIVLDDGQVSV